MSGPLVEPDGDLDRLHWGTVSSIVLIGPSDALPALRERVDAGAELHTFTDAEALEDKGVTVLVDPRPPRRGRPMAP